MSPALIAHLNLGPLSITLVVQVLRPVPKLMHRTHRVVRRPRPVESRLAPEPADRIIRILCRLASHKVHLLDR